MLMNTSFPFHFFLKHLFFFLLSFTFSKTCQIFLQITSRQIFQREKLFCAPLYPPFHNYSFLYLVSCGLWKPSPSTAVHSLSTRCLVPSICRTWRETVRDVNDTACGRFNGGNSFRGMQRWCNEPVDVLVAGDTWGMPKQWQHACRQAAGQRSFHFRSSMFGSSVGCPAELWLSFTVRPSHLKENWSVIP